MMNDVIVKINGNKCSVAYGTGLSALVTMDHPCGGHGKCGKCKVIAKGALSPITDEERSLLSAEELESNVRLACCTNVLGDCSVTCLEEKNTAQIVAEGVKNVMAVAPEFMTYGAAVDIGTTTLAAVLYTAKGTVVARASALNPQTIFGADVVTRIEAAMNGAGKQLRSMICNAVDELLKKLTERPAEIEQVVITGNTVMLHLLTQTDPEPLARAPFKAKRLFDEEITASALGLKYLASDTRIYLPPCISAFVGADMVCALLASGISDQNKPTLLADIGTNGEIALWHQGKLTVCSTAAGPAFEGAGISMGMRGEIGAIDRVHLEDGKLQCHVIGEQQPKGLCGSGLVDSIACLLENGELDESGYMEEDVPLQLPVYLKTQDVRAVQLAKSAIRAGMETILDTFGLGSKELAALYVAGGFGTYLNLANAAKIGLLPADCIDRVEVLGNAALDGASMLLLNSALRVKVKSFTQNAVLLELASDSKFAEKYMEYMMF